MSRAEIDAAIARHAETEVLYDRPYEDRKKVRVAGPFTVESVSPHRTSSFDAEIPGGEHAAEQADEDSFLRTIRDNLVAASVQNGRKSERLIFAALDPHDHPLIQFVGERRGGGNGTPQRVAVSVGPQYGTVSADWVKDAAREALRGRGFDMLVICGFAFDAHTSGTAAEFGAGNDTDSPP